MGRSVVDEMIRARLAFLGAGQRGLGEPRRALEAPADPAGDEPVLSSPPGSGPPGPAARRRFHPRHLLVVALLLLGGVGVTVTALSRSDATQVPIEPVVASAAAVAPTPSASPSETALLRVHVVGAVKSPGVVEVTPGAIVADAIEAAGGLNKNADPALLNLAAPLADGVQVVVGTESSPAGELVGGGEWAAGDVAGGLVNLNTATAAQLEELPGVGPVTAAAILAWREESGPFTAIEELQEVSGIGPKTFEQLEALVRI